MIKVIPTERKTAVLKRSSLRCLSRQPTINLTAGCAHRCLYCYANGYSVHPGENNVVLYVNTLEKLTRELPRKRVKPVSVYFSPSCDLFQPVDEILDLAYRVLEYLLGRGGGVAILTKGVIPPRHMALLCRHPQLVQMQIGMISLEEEIRRVFEPRAAEGETRIAQIRQLLHAGIATQVRMDPILPGVTDSPDHFEMFCETISRLGVRILAAATLFLRPTIWQSLRAHLSDSAWYDRLVDPFREAVWSTLQAEDSPVFVLPISVRRRIYDSLLSAARKHDMHVNICACKNIDLPELASGCHIAGNWPPDSPSANTQLTLFS